MQLGLHRDPKHLPAISVLQVELRRRLWYTILEFAVQSSLDSWVPPRISYDEFDTEPPSNINDESLDESTTELQLALIESLSVCLRIVRLLNDFHSEVTYDRVLSLSCELIDALQACSRWARTNPIFHYSLKLSIDAGLAIISPEPDPGFSRLVAIGGGVFRDGIRCATSAISLELLTHVETQRLNGMLHRTRQYLDFLKQAVRDLISLSKERIRQGETNVKNHMFLSMILAQAEAVEARIPVELQVAHAARDSLELCDDLLKLREDTSSMPSPVDAGLGAVGMEGVQELGFEGFGADFGCESFFPDTGFGHNWLGNLDS
ncbi:uncharacterized protein N7458_001999 [Penicillium daleae]|uniref:Xylanolytic transcriptional activator regulatory domain-containing protein n=1 Tax=Penicillium daleae TaxID=63821 RepID=A0AAD6G6R4_9EURO|nr:uncharacterized protein N7458_001999 [Penicillium daleae]KAJ5460447.1 hypothetical protein N7458_001999 [Penicillium daleae]